jgi:hypothetical protein
MAPHLDIFDCFEAASMQKMYHCPEKKKIRWRKVRAVSRMRQKFDSVESELFLRLSGSMQ